MQKRKTWKSLVAGGLLTALALGTQTMFNDNELDKSENAQQMEYDSLTFLGDDEHYDVRESQLLDEDYKSHVTFQEDAPEPGRVLELDVHIKPRGDVGHALALYVEDNPTDGNLNESSANGGPGFLEKNLSDFFDIQIFSTVYFGSRREPHQLIFDTGSSWLWVQTPECQTCATTNDFKYKQSTTFNSESSSLSQVSYGSGHIWGYRSTDQVCLSAKTNQCVSDMAFIATTNQQGLSGMTSDGIVGLAPVARGQGASLFIEQLYMKGQIDQNLFAFAIGKDFEKSKVMIGGFNLTAHSHGSIIWHDLFDTNYWTLPMGAVAYGNTTFPVQVDQLIVDTGTSLTLIPSRDFNSLVSIITKENPKLDFYKLKNGLSASMCSRDDYGSFQDLSFRVDNITYQLPVSAYVQYSAGQCQLRLMNAPNVGHWILGLNFFHSYYTVFDAGRKRVGFAVSLHSQGTDVEKLMDQDKYFSQEFRALLRKTKTSLETGPLGSESMTEATERNLMILIPLALLIGFITTCCIMKYCKRADVSDIRLRVGDETDQQNDSIVDYSQLLSPKQKEAGQTSMQQQDKIASLQNPNHTISINATGGGNLDRSAGVNNESCEETVYMSQGAASRLIRMESYDSQSSAFNNNRNSLPILQQQMQKQYRSPQVFLDSGQFPSI